MKEGRGPTALPLELTLDLMVPQATPSLPGEGTHSYLHSHPPALLAAQASPARPPPPAVSYLSAPVPSQPPPFEDLALVTIKEKLVRDPVELSGDTPSLFSTITFVQ